MKTLSLTVVVSAFVIGSAMAAELAAPQTIQDCATCPEIVVVPAGQFMMGTPLGASELDAETGEAPQVAVTIEKAFGLGKTEVTTAQYAAFVRETNYKTEAGCLLWDDRWFVDAKSDWRGAGKLRAPKPNAPAICVGWADAQAYVAWLSQKTGKTYRLPSEAEWEYAARAGTTTARFYGAASSEDISVTLACDYANVYDVTAHASVLFPYPYARCKDNVVDLATVASFKPNPYGLHDMIGNVAEWVEDCFTASSWGRPSNQKAWVWQGGCETRGVRGGSWISRPADARSAKRDHAAVNTKATTIGFRVARVLSAGEVK